MMPKSVSTASRGAGGTEFSLNREQAGPGPIHGDPSSECRARFSDPRPKGSAKDRPLRRTQSVRSIPRHPASFARGGLPIRLHVTCVRRSRQCRHVFGAGERKLPKASEPRCVGGLGRFVGQARLAEGVHCARVAKATARSKASGGMRVRAHAPAAGPQVPVPPLELDFITGPRTGERLTLFERRATMGRGEAGTAFLFTRGEAGVSARCWSRRRGHRRSVRPNHITPHDSLCGAPWAEPPSSTGCVPLGCHLQS